MTIAHVAIDVPVPTLFDYLADGLGPEDVGQRVVVPFGKKQVVGVVAAMSSESGVAPEQLKRVICVLREIPPLSTSDLRLLRFAAAYYHHSLGATMMSALPGALRRVARGPGGHSVCYSITPAGAAARIDMLPQRASAQRHLLMSLKKVPFLRSADVAAGKPAARSALKRLIARGWVAPAPLVAPAPPPHPPVIAEGPLPTSEQAEAVTAITSALGRFEPFLLFGVTGSGKTEVYLRCIAAALRAGQQALLLVPEIGLTPQLEAQVRARFPSTDIAVLHSRLGETERLRRWCAAQRAEAGVVLGTRLAVFSPMPKLGLIVVDEEHDLSFKQMDTLHYSARDLAVVRARQTHVPVVLGSGTPALETYHNALSGRYRLLQLNRRVAAAMPRLECISTRGERLEEGMSKALLDAISRHLSEGAQSLVFINRRGYAPVLWCRSCNWLSKCHRCSARLVLHLPERRLHCHHCGFQSPAPVACPECGNQDLVPVGAGTQRVEAALVRHFPTARIMRIDRDTTRRKEAWPAMRNKIHAGDTDIMIGTQIMAKGHDFPSLSLVGVLNADNLLYSSDYRAPERLFALLTQVGGRAGRGASEGEVLVQTEFPHHPLYSALRNHDYRGFAAAVLAERRQAGFPPFVHQALLRAQAPRLDTALEFLRDAAQLGGRLSRNVTIYDPVPAAMVRRAGRARAQLLVQAETRAHLQAFLDSWHAQLAARRSTSARWSLDVDPVEF